jgi:diguanylate cyclase (GGDEF)-like protein
MLIRDTMVPEEDRDEYFKHLRLAHVVEKLKEGNGHYQYRYRINDTERERWYEAAYNYSLQGGEELLLTIRDVHDEVMAEKARNTEELFRRNRERQQILTELGFDIIIDIDLLTSKVELLGDAKSILGRDIICEKFPMGEIEAGMVHPEDIDIVTKTMDFLQSKRTFSVDFRFKRGDDSFFWCRCKAVILQDETGKAYRCICKLTDIDDQKNSEQKLIHKSQRDLLTGLYNNMTTEMLSNDFFSGEGANSRHALLVIDMDNFKQVNDSWGHKTGDKLLRSISEALAASFHSSDIIGRFGGDEFVAVLKNINSVSEIQERANMLRKNIGEINIEELDDSYIPLCSIGVAFFPDHGNTYLEIFKAADKALYYLKKHGKNGIKLYDKSLNMNE